MGKKEVVLIALIILVVVVIGFMVVKSIFFSEMGSSGRDVMNKKVEKEITDLFTDGNKKVVIYLPVILLKKIL